MAQIARRFSQKLAHCACNCPALSAPPVIDVLPLHCRLFVPSSLNTCEETMLFCTSILLPTESVEEITAALLPTTERLPFTVLLETASAAVLFCITTLPRHTVFPERGLAPDLDRRHIVLVLQDAVHGDSTVPALLHDTVVARSGLVLQTGPCMHLR
jgi:hypothetical protein